MTHSEIPQPVVSSEPDKRRGFRVVAKSGSELHHWIEFNRNALQNDFVETGSQSPTVVLGQMAFNNGGTIRSIDTGMIFKSDEEMSDLSSTVYFGGPTGSRVISLFENVGLIPATPKPNEPEEKIDIPALNAYLTRNLIDTPVQVNFDIDEGVISLSTGDENSPRKINIRKVPDISTQALYIETDIPNTIDVAGFEERYQEYARLLEEVVTAIYQSDQQDVPEKVYELTAPRGLAANLAKQQRRIDVMRRNMANQGLIEDDGIVQEIMSRVRLDTRPDVTFDDVAGLEFAKEELQTVKAALEDPQSFLDEGVTPPRGILLYGPPGTGKTLLAKALAHETNAVLYNVNVSDVVHHLYGKTERLFQAVFDAARAEQKPVIIFIDELDALAANRDRSTEVTSRIVSVLLTNLDGLEDRQGNLVVIGATNRREVIDPALLRPGRFTFEIPTTNPDDVARRQVYEIHMRKAVELSQGKELFDPTFDIEAVVRATPKTFSPDDIREIVRRTLAERVKTKHKGQRPLPTTTEQVLAIIRSYQTVKSDKEHTGQYL